MQNSAKTGPSYGFKIKTLKTPVSPSAVATVAVATTEKGFTKLSRKDQKLITRLVQQFSDRSRKDITKWRESLKQAEHPERPRRVLLHDLYKELELDGHLWSQMQIRKLCTLAKEFKIINKKTGKEDKDKTRLLQTPWFYDLLSLALDARFYGTTLIEIGDIIDREISGVTLITRRHVVPERSRILLNLYEWNGLPYNTPEFANWLIEVGKKDDIGLLSKVAPNVIWKRNAMQAWAQFCDMFGMPYRTATTNTRDTKQIDRIEAMLEQMGQAAYGVFPEGTTIDFKETSTGDAFEVFDKNIERQNSEMSKAINSVTMLSDDGSSKSQAGVHKEVFDNIVKADMTFLQFLINWDLITILNAHGYGLEGFEFQWDTSENLPKADQWKIVNDALTQGLQIPDEWITETFGFPITGRVEKTPVIPEKTPPKKNGSPVPGGTSAKK